MADSSSPTRTRALRAAAAVFVVIALALVAWNLSLPIVAYSPGPISSVADAITVEGTETFAPVGELLMLTVISQDVNAFEAAVAAVDPSVDLLARERVRPPDQSDEEYRRRNLQLMDQATESAVVAALAHLEVEGLPPKVFVTGYAPDTPAGDVLEIGDRIVALDGVEIEGADELAPILAGKAPGDGVSIAVERDDEVLEYELNLIESEDEPGRAVIGIIIRQLPYWIDIDAGIIGGPSAGMMFTLGIIDVLTEGELTGGRVIAGTGTINAAGEVGAIGGVRQKVVAAEAAGAEYMLVPEANMEAALTAPREEIELVSIATVDDALEFLESLGGV